MKKWLFIFPVVAFIAFSCENEKKQEKEANINTWTKERSSSINKTLSQEENLKIKLFLRQRENWKPIETGSGLRIWIYEDKEGATAETSDKVDVKYEIRLLNDSLLYKTEQDQVSTFQVDKTDIESGIMEGIKMMSEGDKAKMIVPSYIAHGLLGNFDKIPPLETLLFDIELVKIY